VAIDNTWSSFYPLLARIKEFFALLIANGIDLKEVWFDPAVLNSTAPLRIAGRIDLTGSTEA
jgi:hypothetical protein